MENFDVDDFTFNALLGVLQKGMAMQNDIEEYLRPFNISHGRFSILLTLYGDTSLGMSPSYLADVLNKKRPTVTGMMKKLIKDEMVFEVVGDFDGRQKMFGLAPNGLNLLKKIIPEYNKRIVEIGSQLTLEDKIQLKRLVAKINI